jgi:hypothetical protein
MDAYADLATEQEQATAKMYYQMIEQCRLSNKDGILQPNDKNWKGSDNKVSYDALYGESTQYWFDNNIIYVPKFIEKESGGVVDNADVNCGSDKGDTSFFPQLLAILGIDQGVFICRDSKPQLWPVTGDGWKLGKDAKNCSATSTFNMDLAAGSESKIKEQLNNMKKILKEEAKKKWPGFDISTALTDTDNIAIAGLRNATMPCVDLDSPLPTDPGGNSVELTDYKTGQKAYYIYNDTNIDVVAPRNAGGGGSKKEMTCKTLVTKYLKGYVNALVAEAKAATVTQTCESMTAGGAVLKFTTPTSGSAYDAATKMGQRYPKNICEQAARDKLNGVTPYCDEFSADATKPEDVETAKAACLQGFAAEYNAPAAPGDDATEPEKEETCASEGGSMGWVLCPLVEAMQEVVGWIMGGITDFMNYQTLNNSEAAGADNPIKIAWDQMVAIANIAFAIVFLIVIYSTAIGGKMS